MKSRKHLPLRRNTECYLIFPGGGIEESETPEQALIKKTFEETGAVIEQPQKALGKLKIIWDEDWPKPGEAMIKKAIKVKAINLQKF